jgi:hypothetical protein
MNKKNSIKIFTILLYFILGGCNSKENSKDCNDKWSANLDSVIPLIEAEFSQRLKVKEMTFVFLKDYFPDVFADSLNNIHLHFKEFCFFAKGFDLFGFEEKPFEFSGIEHGCRLLNSRSFTHPYVVTISNKNNKTFLNFKMTDGYGGYIGGRVKDRIYRIIDNKFIAVLDSLIEDMSFWTIPSYDIIEEEICDGTQLLLEYKKEGKYHYVYRTHLERGVDEKIEKFYNLCRVIIDQTRIDLGRDYFDSWNYPDNKSY